MTATAPPPPPAPIPPQPPNSPHRRLRRDRTNRLLGGVASGIARTYGIDVTLVRVLWVIAAIAWIGIPAYVIAWIAIPPDRGTSGDDGERPRDFGLLAGLALVGIGALIAADQLLPSGFHPHRFLAPVLLIGGGLAILVLRRPTAEDDTDTEDASAEPTDLAEGSAEEVPATAWTQTAPWAAPPTAKPPRPPRVRRKRPRPFLTPITISLLMIGAGVTSLLVATDTITLNLTIALGLATGFVGLVLMLSTWIGRATGLIFIGLLLTLATAVSSAIDVPIRGGIGEEIHRPVAVREIPDHYEFGIGHLLIDLRQVPVGDRTVAVNAQLGIGQLEVLVPSTVRVEVQGHAGVGSLMFFGRNDGGWRHDESTAVAATGTNATDGVLHLDVRLGAGQVTVRRFDPDGFETLLDAGGFRPGPFGGRP